MATRFTIQMSGSEDKAGHLRFADFVHVLESVRTTLTQVARMKRPDVPVYYRVVGLRLKSPATVVLEEVRAPAAGRPRLGAPSGIPVRVIDDLQALQKQRLPHAADMGLIDTYRDLAQPLEDRVVRLKFQAGPRSVTLTQGFLEDLERVVGPDESVLGSLTGHLDALNLHLKHRLRFDLYPVVGPPKVRCEFAAALKAQVIAGIDRYVCVHGELLYKSWAKFAYAIKVSAIEVLPETHDRPTLSALAGLAPELADTWRAREDADAWE